MYDKIWKVISIICCVMLCISLAFTFSFGRRASICEEQLDRCNRELEDSRTEVERLRATVDECSSVVGEAVETNRDITEIIGECIRRLQELERILFPVEQTERNLEGDRNSRYHCLSAADLYNYSSIIIEEVE